MYEPKEDLDFANFDFEQPAAPKAKPSLPLERMRPKKVLISNGAPKDENDFTCLRSNAFGHVFSRVAEDEETLEIAFRDASVHEEIVMENNANRFLFADLNNRLLALGSKKNEKGASELYVRHIAAWDRDCALWTSTMPAGEQITSVAVGDDFVVATTDHRNARVFSATGVLRFVFTFEGPLRSLIASGDRFVIVRATGGLVVSDTGDDTEHRYCADVYKTAVLSSTPVRKETSVPLAVTPGSEITWVFLTPNAQLCTMDDVFVVRYLTPGGIWCPIFSGADLLKAADRDAIWPLSVSERPTPTIRYLYCKGRSTPHFDRVEVPLSAAWSLPVDTSTEKGQLEHELVLNELLLSLARMQHASGLPSDLGALLPEHSKQLIKYFALCCKKERDTRALDLAHISTNTQNLQLMMNYASKLSRGLLSNKATRRRPTAQLEYEQTATSFSQTVVAQPQKTVQIQKRKVMAAISTLTTVGRLNATAEEPLTPLRPMNDTMLSEDASIGMLPEDSPASSRLLSKENTPNNRKRSLVQDASAGPSKHSRNTNDDFFDSLM
ncbi:WD40 domain-containing protein [Aphelenchoides fujianensis]|nr:WD40 domain-containing protein [Aphelenchoides fujianensis]